MNTPQFKGENVGIYSRRRMSLHELRDVDMRSLLGLYASELLLYLGFILVLLNNLNVLAPGTYFGAFSWVMIMVFSIGLTINFISIPYLYYSSFKNFKQENDFWDKETFWILPLFFFGTFFLYGSQIHAAVALLVISIVIIAIIHFSFIVRSKKFVLSNSVQTLASHQQYFNSLKYLTAYYVILLAILVVCNPLQGVFAWIRINMG